MSSVIKSTIVAIFAFLLISINGQILVNPTLGYFGARYLMPRPLVPVASPVVASVPVAAPVVAAPRVVAPVPVAAPVIAAPRVVAPVPVAAPVFASAPVVAAPRMVAPVPVAAPIPTVREAVYVPAYAPFARSAVLFGSSKKN
uniref:Skin secretory protein xP2-like n=1 Tax=Strongyloides papillosus TaxID=174720 RepID=A0A0N5BXG8_STREA